MNDMRGKQFLYRDKKVVFESYTLRGEIILFCFKNGTGNLSVEKDAERVDIFLDSLKPIAEETVVETDQNQQPETEAKAPLFPDKLFFEPPILRENKKMLTDLRDALLDDMKKVRSDRNYIPQAKQACNTANSIINLAKLEIAMLRSE
jgi:hypothetical protein